MPGLESFTVMAILDAQDRASEIVDRVTRAVENFARVIDGAAKDAEAASSAIDESLLQTASGADALAVATDRVSASEAKLALATQEQAAAERELQDVYAKGLGLEEQAAAGDKLLQTEKDVTQASKELQAAQMEQQAVEKALAGTTDELAGSEEAASVAATGWVGALVAAAAAVAATGAIAVKAAGDFQSAATHLVTDANEAKDQLGNVESGMLNIAEATGTSTDKIAQGMYHIESAGFHGKAGLDMMTTAAEGAKVGAADLDTVSKTLAGTMDSYKEKGYSATQMMNMLIETTAQGDLHMQDLASSLGKVTPIAAQAGLDFSQVGGAIATMTSQNMTAQQATQNLTNLLVHLQKPNDVQIKQMQQMGIDSNDLATHLGDRGLTGTLQTLIDAVDKSQNAGGKFSSTFRDSTEAAKNAQTMLATFHGTAHQLAQDFMDGKMSVHDYNKAISELPAQQHESAKEFGNLVDKMGSFNTLINSSKSQSQTFNAELASLTGGQIGLRTALMLSTDQSRYFNDATAKIAESAKDAGNTVKNWDVIQGTFNQKVDQAKASLEVLGIRIGTVIMPYVEKLVGVFMKAAEWFGHNKLAVEGLATALGTTLIVILGALAIAAGVVIAALTLFGITLLYIGKAAMYLWDQLKKAWGFVSDEASKLWDNLVKIFNDIKDFVTGIWDDIAGFTESVWNRITKFFKTWWPLLYAIFFPAVFAIQALWHAFHDDIIGFVKPKWEWIKNFLGGAWDWLVDKARTAWNWIYQNIITPIGNLVSAVWDQGSKLNKLVGDLFNGILNWLNGLYNSFLSVGKNILTGIWNGIVSGWDWLMGKVKSLAHGLLDAAKNAIGVSSPSRKFADEFGKMIPAGIAVGIKNGSHLAHSAMSDLSDSLGIDTNIGVNGIGAVSGGAGGSGNVVIIDVRNSQIMTDRDMDIFVDKVGRRLATRILPAGGVRIRA